MPSIPSSEITIKESEDIFRVAGPKMNKLKALIERARETGWRSNSAEPLLLGKLDDFSPEELEELDNIIIQYDEVFFKCTQTEVHQYAASMIIQDIYNGLNLGPHWNIGGSMELLLTKQYCCGAVQTKIPDAHLSEYVPVEDQSVVGPTDAPLFERLHCKTRMILEVAFTHESRDMLVLELVNFLSEFTHVNVAVGVLIFPNEPEFRMQILVMTRITPSSDSSMRTLKQKFRSKPTTKHLHHACVNECTKAAAAIEIENIFKKRTKTFHSKLFNVSVLPIIEVGEVDCHKPLVINIDGRLLGLSRSEGSLLISSATLITLKWTWRELQLKNSG